MRPSCFV
nr:unnamed protein product [Callosobruchus analis]